MDVKADSQTQNQSFVEAIFIRSKRTNVGKKPETL